MRKFTIANLRNAKPTLHSAAFLKRFSPPLISFNFLASSAEPKTSSSNAAKVGALDSRKETVRKVHELYAENVGCGSLHTQMSSSTAGKAKRKPKANLAGADVREVGVFKPENVEDIATLNAKTEKPALHAKSVCEVEERSVQNTAVDRSQEIVSNENEVMINTNTEMNIAAIEEIERDENENMIKAKVELSDWGAKLNLSTFGRGQQWMETAYKLLDYGISCARVKAMLTKCRPLQCASRADSTLKHFTALGMSHEDIGRVISRSPLILEISDDIFQSKVDFFESVGVDRYSLGKIMHRAFRSMSVSLPTLRQRTEFWKNYLQGVQENPLRTLILRNPQILSLDLRTVKLTVAFLEELGFSNIAALGAASILSRSADALAKRAKMLEQLGLSNARTRQIQMMVVNSPRLLCLKEDMVRLKLSYAVNVMNLSLDMLVAYPTFWGFNYENRIKYRHEVLQDLKSLGVYEKTISVRYMLHMNNATFSRRFVEKLQVHAENNNVG